MPLGVTAANVAHAAGESSPGDLPPCTHVVVLAARDEAHLREVAGRLRTAGVSHREVVEVDAPYTGQLMAIGCVPGRKEVVGRTLSSLPLLR